MNKQTDEILNLEEYLSFGCDTVEETIKELLQRYRNRTTTVHCGRNRITFLFPHYVVKIPCNWDGVADNDWEGSISNGEEQIDNHDYVQYARTRMVYHAEIPIVFMERVKYATIKEVEAYLGTPAGKSDWTWSVDGGRVGFNRQGRLVAYDYGCR